MRQDGARGDSRFWHLLVGRSVLAAAAAAVVTFSPDHSPAFGLIVIGVFSLLTGAYGAISARRSSGSADLVRIVLLTAAVTALVGAAALVALLADAGLAGLVAVVAALGLVVAIGELIASRSRAEGAPTPLDHRVLGGTSLLLVIGALLARDNSVVVVGMFGAWAAVTAVYSLITAFTLKWESESDTRSAVSS